MTLFEDDAGLPEVPDGAPLAARMRPRTFAEFVGQAHLVAEDAAFRRAAEQGKLGSAILWGPPGVGKTTLAEIVARASQARFEKISAVSAGVADLRRVVEEARRTRRQGRRTILFIDEIHRFNKAQQDAVLPVVEDGTVALIGATTENPSFEVNAALLSRCRVFVLNALQDDEIGQVIGQALADSERGLPGVTIASDARAALIGIANGDARTALNLLELASAIRPDVDIETVSQVAQRRNLLFDKGGEQHFDLISALHKTVRGSDADAALYWLARLLESGEDPLYVARRLVRMASEDVGLADPQALTQAMAAQQAAHFVGMPEAALALAQATVYMALAPKSNALYTAYKGAAGDVHTDRNDPVPLHLRNAPTRVMKDLGYGAGYKYAHDHDSAAVYQQYLPEALEGRTYYQPTDRGFEAKLRERMEWLRKRWEETKP